MAHDLSEQPDANVDQLRNNRKYKCSPLPTLRDDYVRSYTGENLNLLMDLYKEICSTWRLLTDVRFKLLGFVPVISGALLLGVLSRPGSEDGISIPARIGLAMLGLMVTAALYIYERRNSELYDELISRGRRIEDELGIDTGHFRGRPEPRDDFIKHDTAIGLIYGVTGFAWIFGIIMVLMGL